MSMNEDLDKGNEDTGRDCEVLDEKCEDCMDNGEKLASPNNHPIISNQDAESIAITRNEQIRHVNTPPLRFFDVNSRGEPLWLDPSIEALRNKIWNLYFDQGLKSSKIAELLHHQRDLISRHLDVCRARYDQWIDMYGLSVYGNPAQRLDDLLGEFGSMLSEIDNDLEDEEMSHKDINLLRKLRLEILDRVAKFQAIEPPKRVDLTIRTPAEETRDTMKKLFPDPNAPDIYIESPSD